MPLNCNSQYHIGANSVDPYQINTEWAEWEGCQSTVCHYSTCSFWTHLQASMQGKWRGGMQIISKSCSFSPETEFTPLSFWPENQNFLNPHLPSGSVHPYQLDESISNFRGVRYSFFIFILFWIEIPVSKQCRPWSDAAFCGIRSGSALFAYVPKMGC